MEIQELKKELENYLKYLNIEISDKQAKQFYEYMKLLVEWNEKTNLTAITDPKEIIIKHFIDSLTINKYIKEKSKLIDVGTGAGFPGIPLGIIRGDVKITLIDSLRKRIKFLDIVIQKLRLDNIQSIHGRAEEIGRNKKYREMYDVAVSRAVANTATLSEYLLPLVKKEGKGIYMKGPEVDDELEKGKRAINVFGGNIIKIEKFELPKTEIKRTIVIVEKGNITPEKYPRKAGIPSKDPIL